MPVIRTRRPLVFILALAVCIFLLAILQTGVDNVSMDESWQDRVQVLQNRLENTERLSEARAIEVHHLQKKVHDMESRAHNISFSHRRPMQKDTAPSLGGHYELQNTVNTTIDLPSAIHYLPHLKGKSRGLKPALHVSQGVSGVSVVLGIPTIKRTVESYLMDTLQSIVNALSQEEKMDTLVVVFIAETDLAYAQGEAAKIQSQFAAEVESGLIDIISPPVSYYPDLDNLPETFGDTHERVKWRTKQNLDFAFLMMYCRTRGLYYVQLEDDIIAVPNFVSTMKSFADQQNKNPWLLLEFSQLGFIGKLFKCEDLNLVADFFLMFHKAKPIDWLLDHILFVLVCNPEKDAKHCSREKARHRIRYKPSLFQHIGLHSSLKGKIQKLKDRDFKKGVHVPQHNNPVADVSTTLQQYQKHSLEKAYRGQDIFWGTNPNAGDVLRFKFSPAVDISEYRFMSGSSEIPGDKLFNTTVQVLPVEVSASAKQKFKLTDDGFLVVGSFIKDGSAFGEIPSNVGALQELRLRITSDLENWVILSEIYLKVRGDR
ncbi:Alpha-1,3-mannosyl-glycoprotein 4-beta-N-acetylglucosaminyltransferase B [Holothuria leucospilota]|uniref:Alpha-1,3-mannosyl-glycoprotein 4-beta-N-acetylglucosaminyltransferase B n=1 Tax=Holothuria leucospilota TaxID=206669 RepID=A0A9Q1BLE9_HOLLE|nr:Alpha-1,3-mannosyl-glycoprotein 4-beta-N-acetylglucosaminyltransferase B [Holothuria leucospilota]